MSDYSSFIDRTRNAEDRGSLPWWAPTPKTPHIVGIVVEYQEVQTQYGRLSGAVLKLLAPAVVQDGKGDRPRLAKEDEECTIWLKNTVLRNEWEQPKPVGGPPAIGEVVGVKRVGERTGDNGAYPIFAVLVEGREGQAPRASATAHTPMSQADALGRSSLGDPGYPGGIEGEEEGEEEGGVEDGWSGGDDDLPF